MSSVRRLDGEKVRARRIIATATLTVATVAFLLLRDTSTPVSAMPTAADSSYQAAVQQVLPDPAEPGQTSVGQTSMEPVVLYLNPDDPPAGQPPDPEDSSPSAIQQRSFKSRRALETVDPRQFRR